MTVSSEAVTSVETNLSEDAIQLMRQVITRYKTKTPSDLELLTTAIYAYEHTDAKTQEDIVEKVKTIKGEKYNDREIQWALSEFSYFGITL